MIPGVLQGRMVPSAACAALGTIVEAPPELDDARFGCLVWGEGRAVARAELYYRRHLPLLGGAAF